MKNLSKIAISASILTLLVGASFGQAPAKCPVCKMPLATKKSAADPTPVRLKKGGKVLFCCPKCKMPASVLVKK